MLIAFHTVTVTRGYLWLCVSGRVESFVSRNRGGTGEGEGGG